VIGISLDESQRMKLSGAAFIENAYPLVERRLTRGGDECPSRRHAGLVGATGEGVDHVVHGRERLTGGEHLAPCGRQTLQRHAAGALVQHDPVDEDERGAVAKLAYRMAPPKLVEEGFRHSGTPQGRSGAVAMLVCIKYSAKRTGASAIS